MSSVNPCPRLPTGTLGGLNPFWAQSLKLGSVNNLYPTVLDVAVAYFYKFCCGDHPFANGNKRLGILFTHIFLLAHDLDFMISNQQLYGVTKELAKLSASGATTEEALAVCRKVLTSLVGPRPY